MAYRRFDEEVRAWARIGAERRLVELADEAAAIHRAFPELRDRHEVSAGAVGRRASVGPEPGRKHRRRMSAAGRAKLRASLKKRWAAAKKAGKTSLG